MSVQTEITRLNQAKTDLRTAIQSKGVSVASTDHLDTYPSKVNAIVVATNNVYTGSDAPASSLGSDGDIYIKL